MNLECLEAVEKPGQSIKFDEKAIELIHENNSSAYNTTYKKG